jgi:hypothetical protein
MGKKITDLVALLGADADQDNDLVEVVDVSEASAASRNKKITLKELLANVKAFVQSGTGAVARTAQSRFRDYVHVFDFMTSAQIADVIAGTALEDVTTAITNALATLDLAGTATYSTTPTKALFCPAGIYKFSSAIEIPKNCRIVGEGKNSTIFSSAHTGNGFTTTNPIDSSTNINVALENLAIWNSHASNTGAGYVDLGGTQLSLYNVQIKGFKYNIIFDQSELAYVDLCDLEFPLTAAIWLVNGPERTAGADTFFTNRITVSRSQLSSTNAGTAIIDDGGYTHVFEDNNYNGWTNHIRAAGVVGLAIRGGQFEGATAAIIKFETTTNGAGTSVGACQPVYIGGGAILSAAAGIACIAITSVGGLYLNGLQLAGTGTKVTGASLARDIFAIGVVNLSGGATFDGEATYHFHADGENGRIESTYPTTHLKQVALKRVSATYTDPYPINAALGNLFVVQVTGTSAFTISDPTNGVEGQRITIMVRKTGGGAMGVITWGSAYKMSAWTNPADTFSRSIDFIYDGTNWVQVSQTGVDVTN